MRNLCYILLFTSFFLSIMIINITVSATSWVGLKPQDVVERAEVIVTGKYDFSTKPKPSDFVFQGLDFNVINVYKGDISKQFMAGIDYNDVGWAEEFQSKGGEFLLFLEKSEDADFLIPVGSPNGMVQVTNDKVEHPDEERKTFFEDFLKAQPEKTSVSKLDAHKQGQNDESYILLYVATGVLVGIGVVFLLYLYIRKKIFH
ncbi:hypothetical protein JOC75_000708 [Metabacillus crassostreae]|uniref:hypothetical protein n=1 Tax=Metabacillus crassostreae TaxID=929098 RepID=UPI0019599F51|nr:hypothetical protein [Metabacillus crassostreae]MBM7602738.1 hypothetical protein [Metabacillus crassostreae]